jgi:biopolymer transport protein ExbD
MRIPNSRDRDNHRNEQSMTAMIDVVFLLLIFFVCASVGQMGELLLGTEMTGGAIESTEFAKQPRPLGEVWVTLRHPDGATVVQVSQGQGVTGRVFRQGKAAEFRSAPDFADFQAVLSILAETDATIPVILDVEKSVPMGEHHTVLTAVKNAGFRDIKFAIDSAPAAKKSP